MIFDKMSNQYIHQTELFIVIFCRTRIWASFWSCWPCRCATMALAFCAPCRFRSFIAATRTGRHTYCYPSSSAVWIDAHAFANIFSKIANPKPTKTYKNSQTFEYMSALRKNHGEASNVGCVKRFSWETRIKKNINASKKISSTHQKLYICI